MMRCLINLFVSQDGRFFVTRAGQTSAVVWNSLTGQSVFQLKPQFFQVTSAALSPNGRKLAVVNDQVRVWDLATGEPITPFFGTDVKRVTFSADGKWLATIGTDSVRTWDAWDGSPLSVVMNHKDQINSACFSLDTRVGPFTEILTASDDGTAMIWNARTGEPLSAPLPHPGKVYSASFSPIAPSILTVSEDGERIWPTCNKIPTNWVLDFAESLAQRKVDQTGAVTPISLTTLTNFQAAVRSDTNTANAAIAWARKILLRE